MTNATMTATTVTGSGPQWIPCAPVAQATPPPSAMLTATTTTALTHARAPGAGGSGAGVDDVGGSGAGVDNVGDEEGGGVVMRVS